jgi:acyl-CoA synthetase (AMP-forming)/AMP-acid ligase II
MPAKDNHDAGGADVYLPVVPYFHANGWGIPYMGLMLGMRLLHQSRFMDSATTLAMAVDHGATHSAAVPAIWQEARVALQKDMPRCVLEVWGTREGGDGGGLVFVKVGSVPSTSLPLTSLIPAMHSLTSLTSPISLTSHPLSFASLFLSLPLPALFPGIQIQRETEAYSDHVWGVGTVQ